MSLDLDPERSLAPFFASRHVSRIQRRLSSGKEAVVYCCEAGPALRGFELVAAKLYRPPERRAFKRHMDYADGRHVAGRTARQALKARNTYGRRVLFEQWIAFEHQVLGRLHRRGVRVPQPLGCREYVVLMEYLGDRDQAAPHLRNVQLPQDAAARVTDEILADVENMLANQLVHGDLSPYNVLYWDDVPWIIDVPQALDPRENLRAQQLLLRDVTRICDWARQHGVERDPLSIATEMWIRWLHAEL